MSTNHHTASALALTDDASNDSDGTLTDRLLREAQIHATLALVEEQRIANHLAVLSLPHDTMQMVAGAVAARGSEHTANWVAATAVGAYLVDQAQPEAQS